MKRASVIALGAGLWLFGAAPGALASGATPPQPTDPKASSPAGTIYEIPLDAARSDAAPHRQRRGGAGPASGGGGGSSTSAGGGSSSGGGSTSSGGSASSSGGSASGSAGSGSGGSASGSAGSVSSSVGSASGSGGAAAASDPSSLVHSENGFGSSSDVPGLGGGSDAARPALSNGGGGAPIGPFALIGVVLLVGAYAGIFASRRARA